MAYTTRQIVSNLRAWVSDLRSGEYEQADGKLHFEGTGRYCCLGVACNTYHERTKRGWWDGDRFFTRARSYAEDMLKLERHRGETQNAVARWLGLPQHVEHRLANMNDRGSSFETIADYIERELIVPKEAELVAAEAEAATNEAALFDALAEEVGRAESEGMPVA